MRTMESGTLLLGVGGRRLALIVLSLSGIGFAGCGSDSGAPSIGNVYDVKGTVLLPSGKPLNSGKIYFVRKDGSMTSEGKIDGDGHFALVTGHDDGAPEGDYKVRLEPADPSLLSGANLGRRAAKGAKKLPFSTRYLDEDSSGLIAKVEPHANQIQPFLLK